MDHPIKVSGCGEYSGSGNRLDPGWSVVMDLLKERMDFYEQLTLVKSPAQDAKISVGWLINTPYLLASLHVRTLHPDPAILSTANH